MELISIYYIISGARRAKMAGIARPTPGCVRRACPEP
jgi:hypothetical protein